VQNGLDTPRPTSALCDVLLIPDPTSEKQPFEALLKTAIYKGFSGKFTSKT
jgi:hypothetical protein